MISYVQAVVVGVLQGVSELFPVSSLGHSVLVPALIGGGWEQLVTQSSTSAGGASPYLAIIVALHVATAVALLVFYRSDWARIMSGLVRTLGPSLAARRLVTRDEDERLAWLLITGTIPVGITGLAMEHTLRTLFAKPLAAAIFLTLNGIVLLAGERLRRMTTAHCGEPVGVPTVAVQRRSLASLSYREAAAVGFCQTFALFAGISRSGVTMVGGLARGLSHRDAVRFAFLLATPVILAAGLLKLPTLAGPAGSHIRGQVVVGAIVAGIAAYLSVRWLTRYFQTRTLTPFAVYCLLLGTVCVARFA